MQARVSRFKGNRPRLAQVLVLRRAGWPYSQIGESVGMGAEMVRRLLLDSELRLRARFRKLGLGKAVYIRRPLTGRLG